MNISASNIASNAAAMAQAATKPASGGDVNQSNSDVQIAPPSNTAPSNTIQQSEQHSEVVTVDGPDTNIQESDNLAQFSTTGDTQSYLSENNTDNYYGTSGEGVTQVNVDEQTESNQESEQINVHNGQDGVNTDIEADYEVDLDVIWDIPTGEPPSNDNEGSSIDDILSEYTDLGSIADILGQHLAGSGASDGSGNVIQINENSSTSNSENISTEGGDGATIFNGQVVA